MSIQLGTITGAVAIVASLALASPAAAINCRSGTQLIQGTWMATPYCQDVLLAQVGRQSGYAASLEKIRNNPNYKKELCRGVFTDIRVADTCRDAGVPEWRR
jgi:hypothetical protein